jgi:hypothetical protein
MFRHSAPSSSLIRFQVERAVLRAFAMNSQSASNGGAALDVWEIAAIGERSPGHFPSYSRIVIQPVLDYCFGRRARRFFTQEKVEWERR